MHVVGLCTYCTANKVVFTYISVLVWFSLRKKAINKLRTVSEGFSLLYYCMLKSITTVFRDKILLNPSSVATHGRYMPVRWSLYCEIHIKFENCAVFGYYAACNGNSLPTFRDCLSVPFLND